ncbi:ribonuclease H1 domain-containing protein [Niallia sp. Sow4_A1]|jgi:ribonuclease HI|uniref:Ribonuclease H n=1 Tax=Niallia hominis TaxID=3133173 RepID=A0ABV1F3M3_9BACI|nr:MULTISPECIES: ribonuclease H family protein [Bacillaceae]MCF2650219.1 ribonuclease H family protein [Niallia circulans]MCM3362216.1 ribonuclease H family protein [Niallia sp. MER TA 168]CAI9394489.1 Ribonuclease H [Bacillus sp. T2.9-1]
MAGKKYYVVWNGRKPGIYRTWAECEKQTKGFKGAAFKSYQSLEEAEKAFNQGGSFGQKAAKGSSSKKQANTSLEAIDENSISVDAACSGNPGLMEYRGVHTKTGEVLFHYGPVFGTNNIGEFLGIVHALSLLQKQEKNTTIYSDSMTALSWVRNKKANTTLVRDKRTEELWQLIERAEKWLKENNYSNKILKWDTNKYGEIKADFGRK